MLRLLSLLSLLLTFSATMVQAERVYQKPSAFLRSVFGGQLPQAQLIDLDRSKQNRIKRLIGHKYPTSRVRYWASGDKTAFILEEIGKTEPITTGLVVSNGRISQVQVLIYRESHGYEVSSSQFCKQFENTTLNQKGRLTNDIRNIAGATLSVRALENLGRVALFLDSAK